MAAPSVNSCFYHGWSIENLGCSGTVHAAYMDDKGVAGVKGIAWSAAMKRRWRESPRLARWLERCFDG
jgi:hypothetical protein